MSMRIGLGLGLSYRMRGPVPAYLQILALAEAAGALAVYDPDNPNTWTLRDDGGTLFYAEVADGLGNLPALAQATTAAQPRQKTLSTGRRVFENVTADWMQTVNFSPALVQPTTLFTVARAADGVRQDIVFGSVTSQNQLIRKSETGNVLHVFAGTVLNTAVAFSADWNTLHAIYDGTSSFGTVGEAAGGSGNAGTNPMANLLIMIGSNLTANPVAGEIGPVIIFDSRKSAADLAALRAAINTHYPIGLTA